MMEDFKLEVRTNGSNRVRMSTSKREESES